MTSTAADDKNAGNRLCFLHRYDEALTYYSKAISKNPQVPIYFSNRALCHLKLKNWSLAIQDCFSALELDPDLIKALFFLGQALTETGDHDTALKHLQKAHELSKEKKLNFGDDIAYQIRLVKRHKWNRVEKDDEQLEDEMKNYLVKLIMKDKEEQLRTLKDVVRGDPDSVPCNTTGHCSSDPMPAASSNSQSGEPIPSNRTIYREPGDLEAQESEIQRKCDSYIDKLESMITNLKLQRMKREVPDYLCGKISFEIMHDPVITPSGITYDRQDIEEHLSRVGHFDPITRQPLKATQLIPNLAMKEVVDAYLSENEWALYY